MIQCPPCTDLSELICLTSVGGYLSMGFNDGLTDLYGLNGLTSVGGQLSIVANDTLTSLDGLLGNLILIGAGFGVAMNPMLPDCEVCELLDQIWYGPPSPLGVHSNLDDGCTPVPGNCP